MSFTKGEWKVAKVQYEGKFPSIHVYREEAPEPIIGQGTGRVICVVSNTDSPDAEANAYLITAAVNACQSVNLDNPMAVAESVKDMYEALKDIIKYLTRLPTPTKYLIEEKTLVAKADKALVKVEGKQ